MSSFFVEDTGIKNRKAPEVRRLAGYRIVGAL